MRENIFFQRSEFKDRTRKSVKVAVSEAQKNHLSLLCLNIRTVNTPQAFGGCIATYHRQLSGFHKVHLMTLPVCPISHFLLRSPKMIPEQSTQAFPVPWLVPFLCLPLRLTWGRRHHLLAAFQNPGNSFFTPQCRPSPLAILSLCIMS